MSMSPKVACLLTAIITTTVPNLAVADVFPEGHFQLTTQFREGNNECLIANANGTTASMMECKNFTGQWWKATPIGDGYFKLTTQASESKKQCLESNLKAGDALHKNGAAYMYACENVTGQAWKAIPIGDGYFKLTSKFRENENECLEGNQKAGSKNSGASYMDSCQDVSGQAWKVKPKK
ncbi:RICIN domain-containing protein [Rheinheimera sp.]|uniref:RICIN domain-containing protein n=1 Tax=Rheinheimera sp. TaxID=1869214 RepID=UPI003AF90853